METLSYEKRLKQLDLFSLAIWRLKANIINIRAGEELYKLKTKTGKNTK